MRDSTQTQTRAARRREREQAERPRPRVQPHVGPSLIGTSSATSQPASSDGAEPVDPAGRPDRRLGDEGDDPERSRRRPRRAGARRASGSRGARRSARRARCRGRRRCRGSPRSARSPCGTRSRGNSSRMIANGEREDGAAGALDHARRRSSRRSSSRARRAACRAASTTSTMTSARFLPNMSPSRPAIGVTTDALSRYAVRIHAAPPSSSCEVVLDREQRRRDERLQQRVGDRRDREQRERDVVVLAVGGVRSADARRLSARRAGAGPRDSGGAASGRRGRRAQAVEHEAELAPPELGRDVARRARSRGRSPQKSSATSCGRSPAGALRAPARGATSCSASGRSCCRIAGRARVAVLVRSRRRPSARGSRRAARAPRSTKRGEARPGVRLGERPPRRARSAPRTTPRARRRPGRRVSGSGGRASRRRRRPPGDLACRGVGPGRRETSRAAATMRARLRRASRLSPSFVAVAAMGRQRSRNGTPAPLLAGPSAQVAKSGIAPCGSTARPFGSSHSSWRPSAVRSRKSYEPPSASAPRA